MKRRGRDEYTYCIADAGNFITFSNLYRIRSLDHANWNFCYFGQINSVTFISFSIEITYIHLFSVIFFITIQNIYFINKLNRKLKLKESDVVVDVNRSVKRSEYVFMFFSSTNEMSNSTVTT